ncbi:MAG: acetylornithine deacetylase [Ferruginibacter sp.]|nr:acetylornithine deacetylase [Ferruginibacter sp.]
MMNDPANYAFDDILHILHFLVERPSLSREESLTADCLQDLLSFRNIPANRLLNNVWAVNASADKSKPTILLNSHHDTVAPNAQYTRNPYEPVVEGDKMYGLGTTDAGASLVCLLNAFVEFYHRRDLPFNLLFAASAEEEISGRNGMEKLFANEEFASWFQHPGSFAIVGEPTQLNLAIAEKGLMVLDCTATGKPGHAARHDGVNALYKAMDAIRWIKDYHFEKTSPLLGEVKMTVTSINTKNTAHNIIPESCDFVVDIRLNECYSHEEVLQIVREGTGIDCVPRSMRLKPSAIEPTHPIVKAGIALGKSVYGSPTMSDQALIPLPSLKCGPGFSEQSHSADEYILLEDLRAGFHFYPALINELIKEWPTETL